MSDPLLLSNSTWSPSGTPKLFSKSLERFTLAWASAVETSSFPFVLRLPGTYSPNPTLWPQVCLWNAALLPTFGTDLHLFQGMSHQWAPTFPPASAHASSNLIFSLGPGIPASNRSTPKAWARWLLPHFDVILGYIRIPGQPGPQSDTLSQTN